MSDLVISSEFPEDIQSMLRSVLSKGSKIDASIVQTILTTMDIEIGHLMIQLLPTAASYARVPISNFHVGAVALGMPPGSLYLGSNMEFPGEALSFSVHAEQSATNNAWLHGETGLQALAINAAPCGYCRQFLYEISTATKGFNILLKKNDNPTDYSYTMESLEHYLPDAFGPGDLGITERLMQPEQHSLTITGTSALAQAALQAAEASYSPYTKDFCGVAIQQADGSIFAGRYAENAAYNPSLSPMESALADLNMNAQNRTDYNIVAACLVEAQTKISQKSATEDVLASVAPGVTLEYYPATPSS